MPAEVRVPSFVLFTYFGARNGGSGSKSGTTSSLNRYTLL